MALGLFDYISEWFAKDEGRKKTKVGKIKVTLVTFAVPITFSLFYPTGFVFALGFAAISLSLLAAILPSLIGIAKKRPTSLVLNKVFLFLMLLGGLAIIGTEVLSKLF